MRRFLCQKYLRSRDIARAVCEEENGGHDGLLGISGDIASNYAETERESDGVGGKDAHACEFSVGVGVWEVAD